MPAENEMKMICPICSSEVTPEAEASKKCGGCGASFYHYRPKLGIPGTSRHIAEALQAPHHSGHAAPSDISVKSGTIEIVSSDTLKHIDARELAIAQRRAIIGFISGVFYAIPYAIVLILPFQLFCYFKLSVALKLNLFAALLLAALMLVPILNLLVLLGVNYMATTKLRSLGLKVGFLGVKKEDIPSNT